VGPAAVVKDSSRRFADLHHCGVHDLRPGKPPESKLDGGEGNEGAQSFGKVLEVLGETPAAAVMLTAASLNFSP
jgi:hypothetical protein